MSWGTKAVIAMVALGLIGCGGDSKSESDEVHAHYLRFAKHVRAQTLTIDGAAEHPSSRPRQVAREFRSFASRADYATTYLLTVRELGPVGDRAFVLQHSLSIYEATLREVVRRARRGERPPERDFAGVRQAGAEVRAADGHWEAVLRAALAG
jgi:hypothetical protein